jgi:hypothetical protein
MMNIRRWNKYFASSILFICICVTRLFLILNKLSWSFKRFLKTWNDNVTQSLHLLDVWYFFHAFFHLLCNSFLKSLFVNRSIICSISSFSTHSFVNQTCLRSSDVMFAWRRLLCRVWVNFCLILSQCLKISVLCALFGNLIRDLICRYARCNSINCIWISTFKNFLSLTRNVSLIIRDFFW